MLSFFTRRVGFIFLVVLLIAYFAFIGMSMMPNSERAVPNFNLLDHGEVAWERTQVFLSSIFQDRLGVTAGPVSLPVRDVVRAAYVNSMGLLLVALVLSTVMGVYVGTLAALARSRRWVVHLLTMTILGVSTPSFVAALFLQQAELRFYQTFGRRLVSMGGFGWDYKHMLLPVLVLMARPLAYLTRTTFINLRRILDENYIRTAHAKGLPRRSILQVHAFRNLAVPTLTAVGVSLRFSLSSLPVVEFFFGWPGLGYQLVQAIDARDQTLTVALAVSMGVTFLLFNLLLDVVYRVVDPRLREAR